METGKVAVQNGWSLYGHPLFLQRLEDLVSEVEELSEEDPDGFTHHSTFKLYDKVAKAMMERIPADPSARAFLLGNTMGEENRHWRRAKEGLPDRYRLFFQYRSAAPQTIIYVWLNDCATLRKDGARTDVYVVFRKMLTKGTVPGSFDELLKVANPVQTGTEEE
ncbi:type II toxin-antitoxin system YhaV family toxin [Pseudomonas nitroreducens]|uniref:Toxin YhaV n=1 Tax=Pseudomonas nitroreducens TaxID=46680 RepID=A0A2D0ADW5_PSENT|nr:type II toxin-antitoxin system YhaV family toxin [Pseudomonas nitroreducens]OWP50280.1 hypothetical protein CEG18_12060 [Pseudomonas nitroreducens]